MDRNLPVGSIVCDPWGVSAKNVTVTWVSDAGSALHGDDGNFYVTADVRVVRLPDFDR